MNDRKRRVDKQKIGYFHLNILHWFKNKGRHFPWRNKSASNYEKIISEVLLQRTKAGTAARFYPGFINKYPSWSKLAEATEEELKEALTPIGLQKQRAKRVFALAREMKKRRGRFPNDREEIESIPMFGQYITNAIMLLVYGKPFPLLDVNMSRVLERFFGPREMSDIRYDPYLQDLAYKIVNLPQPQQINWAILDFAALVCRARAPLCKACPINSRCKYYKVNERKKRD
ncbi:MAG: hypothetical protein KAW12_15800 [Candidatus Aminicenantes bacterium]|nr:hypothetical protein [Candidatus Aminicenantes bacterium]